MFGIGFGELAVIAVVALLVFGPERLPQMARRAGRFIVDMRKMLAKARSDLSVSANDLGLAEEDRELLRELRNPKSTMRQRLVGDDDFGINEENLSLDDRPKRKPSARPYDPAPTKDRSSGSSAGPPDGSTSTTWAGGGAPCRTGPKNNPTSTNGNGAGPADSADTNSTSGSVNRGPTVLRRAMQPRRFPVRPGRHLSSPTRMNGPVVSGRPPPGETESDILASLTATASAL